MPTNIRNVLMACHTATKPQQPDSKTLYELARKKPKNNEMILLNHGLCAWIEEEKMQSDIKYFDAVNISMTAAENKAELDFFLFKQQFPASSDRNKNNMDNKVYTLLLTFSVLGSNESRPKVQVGDRVRIRPTMHSLAETAKRWQPTNPLALQFELHAIVQSYELRTEKVTCELPMLSNSCITFLEFLAQMGVYSNTAPGRSGMPGFQSVGRGQSQNFIKFLESLTYQVRFHYDSTGLTFCHEAIHYFLPQSHFAPGAPNRIPEPPLQDMFGSLTDRPLRPFDLIFPRPGLKKLLLVDSGRSDAVQQIASKIRHEMLSGTNVSGMGSHDEYNEEQLECISSIVALNCTPDVMDLPPYCISGPPGTGKTKCVVGSLIEILERFPQARILACAPSDAAADVLAIRLSRYLLRRREILVKSGMMPTKMNHPHYSMKHPLVTPLNAHGLPAHGMVPGFAPGIVPGMGHAAAALAMDHKLLRLNWYNRVYDSVPVELLGYCHLPKGGKLFDIPNYDVLKQFRIIVTTCGVAGALRHNQTTMYDPYAPQQFSTAIVPLDFDYVFVDEASQCTEAEALIPVSLVKRGSAMPTRRGGIVVLAGDPKQLGPVTRSDIYREMGVKTLLERLLDNEFYADVIPVVPPRPPGMGLSLQQQMATHKRPFCMGVMLIHNYRSHRALLEVPSRLFYYSALREAVRDRSKVDRFLPFSAFLRTVNLAPAFADMSQPLVFHTEPEVNPQPGFPCVFVGVQNKHDHPLDSPSFFNVGEIDAIVVLCKLLVSCPQYTNGRLLLSDIGIIGAFRAQVLKIRLALRKENLGAISVGSVEDFQGQEKQVILVSTVLSSKPSILSGHALGLINDARRFNVAVTRGMGMCIVVGSPAFLHKDFHWREWIEFCELHSTFLNSADCRLFERHRKEELEADELLDMVGANSLQFLDDEDETDESAPTPREGDSNFCMPTDQLWRSLL